MAQAAFWPKAPFFHWNRWICFDTFFPNCSLNYFVCIVSLGRTTAESLTNQNEVEVQRRCEERQQEIGHMQEILETKIQLLQEVHIVFLCAINWPHYDYIHISSIYYLKQFCCSWFIILVCFEANSALRDSIQNRVYFISLHCVLCHFCFQEAQLTRIEAEKMASLADSESQRYLALERRMMMEMQGGNESLSAMAQHEEMAKKDR